jgi:hypothetical protein
MRLRLGLILLTLLAALAMASVVPYRAEQGSLTGDHRTPVGPRATGAPDRHGQPRQTSDGEPGTIAPAYNPFVRSKPRITHDRHWRVAPGIVFRKWVQSDHRGRAKLFLLKARPSVPGVSVQYGVMPYVPQRAPVPTLVAEAGGLGGVNGGFFDIYDTGAPLGVGVDRQRGFLHAASETWLNTFFITPNGTAHIAPKRMRASIAEYPQIRITNYNSPRVRAGSIGIYTSDWGDSRGYSITDGQTKSLRTVLIEDGRVVANRVGVTKGYPVTGTLLVGRGYGATQLAQLRVGSRAQVSWSLPGRPVMAVGGETILLKRGRVLARDDSILHPRTAIGIDRDTGQILLLVVDGRTESSDGYTLVQLAKMMRSLGAEDALNLDGGGSSTMVAPSRRGTVQVQNHPSDGSLRSVADSIVFRYSAPKG